MGAVGAVLHTCAVRAGGEPVCVQGPLRELSAMGDEGRCTAGCVMLCTDVSGRLGMGGPCC